MAISQYYLVCFHLLLFSTLFINEHEFNYLIIILTLPSQTQKEKEKEKEKEKNSYVVWT